MAKYGNQGPKNIEKINQEVEQGKRLAPNTRHGAWNRHIRKRYSDERTREGKRLKAVMQEIVADIGGKDKITVDQSLKLSNIRTKLIVLLQIGKFIDEQPDLIVEGDVLPVLKRTYLQYSESLDRDLDSLYATIKRDKTPSLDDYISAKYGGKE